MCEGTDDLTMYTWAQILPIHIHNSQFPLTRPGASYHMSIRICAGIGADDLNRACFTPPTRRGFLPCLLRSIPANGTMLVTVDLVRNQLMSKEDLGNPSLQRHPTEMFRS